MKTTEQYFVDWFSHVFGYCYGSGEQHIVPALRLFFGAVPSDGNYNYNLLEEACGPTVAWLLINALCPGDVECIEYGSSPRFAWLTDAGKLLREFMISKSDDELLTVLDVDESHVYCGIDYCNCLPRCQNPFFPRRIATERSTRDDE